MIRTIFFDFGNVVAFFDHGRAVRRFARHTAMDPVELALALYGGPLADDYECGKRPTEEFVREALLNGRLSCGPDEFLAAYTDIFWPNPEVIDLLPRLKGRYRLVLGSNTNDAHYLRYTKDYADALGHFDHLVVSHHAGARKPHAEFFEYALRFARAEPHECVFVDDLPINVEAAEKAGLCGVVYTPDGSLPARLRSAGVGIDKL
ncbi:MAG: HAD family phosphatase [Gemmataceae bacterium]|nr:HAD family phosphatase [Gemmataceae bacterium]